MSGWEFEATRLETDEHGQEWVCVPWSPHDDVPTVLRRVADEWEAANAGERDQDGPPPSNTGVRTL